MLKRSMHLLIFINLVFAATTFSLLYFTGRKIQTYVLMIYAYAPQLQDIQTILEENANLADLNKLNEAVAVINQAYKMIFMFTIASLITFFFVWCFFQSMQWRITYKSLKKAVKLDEIFHEHWKYALKFSLTTIPAFIIILPTFYYFISHVQALFRNILLKMYGIAETQTTVNYVSLIALFIVFLISTYFIVLIYITLNKEQKLIKAVKNSFRIGIKKIHILLPIHFAAIIVLAPIIYLDSYLIKFLDFKIAAVISLLIYFAFVAYYQILMTVLLEKK